MMSALFAAWMAFSIGPVSGAEERYSVPYPAPVPFQKILVLFSADTPKEDRDEFLAGLEEVRLRHQKEYYETYRKWRESAPAEPETAEPEENDDEEDPFARRDYPPMPAHDLERLFHHNPFFLRSVNVMTIRTNEDLHPPFSPVRYKSRLRDMSPVVRMHDMTWEYEAVIVVASDTIAAELQRLHREQTEVLQNETVYLFAGVSTFDESLRKPQEGLPDLPENARARYSFAIRYEDDPWPNTDLALTSFPKTRKIILLAPRSWWSADKMEKYRAKLGPVRALKTILLPEIPDRDATEADVEAMKERFVASVKAEIQPETVIVSLSSVETGEDPISWLPKDFRACPIFADTKPSRPSMVGGFCRSLGHLGVQAADLLERLSEDPLPENKLPAVVIENDELWLNSHALRKYGLKTAGFPENALLTNTSSTRAPVRLGYTLTRKRVVLLLLANVFVFLCVIGYAIHAVRRAKMKRQIAESVYGALPVRVIVLDRDGRLLEYHRAYDEVERIGEFPWSNIEDVPWLRGRGVLQAVQGVFDSGKKSVIEFVVEGQRRVVVLSRTESDVFGRPAVIAVSSNSPSNNA